MIKGNDIIGRPVIAHDTGAEIAQVQQVIFDHLYHQVVAFVVERGGWRSRMRILPWSGVYAVHPDKVLARSARMIVDMDQMFAIRRIMERNKLIKGTPIATTDGQSLGRMDDLYFDSHTGRVEGYAVSPNLPGSRAQTFLPNAQTFQLKDNMVLVPPKTLELMQEKAGGIKRVWEAFQMRWRKDSTYKDSQTQDEQDAAGSPPLTGPLLQRIIEQAKGCRVRYDLKTEDGRLVAARGQIVNDGVIERAQNCNKITELLKAVGLDVV